MFKRQAILRVYFVCMAFFSTEALFLLFSSQVYENAAETYLFIELKYSEQIAIKVENIKTIFNSVGVAVLFGVFVSRIRMLNLNLFL